MKLACANSDWLKADLASAFEKAASDFPVENESFLDLNLATKDSGKRQQDNILIRKANFVHRSMEMETRYDIPELRL